MNINEAIQDKVGSVRRSLFGDVGNNASWVDQEFELLHKRTTLETQIKDLTKDIAEAIGGTALMTPVAMLMSPVAILRLSGVGEALHAGAQADFNHFDYEYTSSTIDHPSMLYLAPDTQVVDRLYVDENTKDRSYFLVEGDSSEAIGVDTANVVEGYGLLDVDKTRLVQYKLEPVGTNPNSTELESNRLLETVAGRLTQEGMTILPTSMVDITFEDTALVPVNSFLVGRRGGMHNAVVRSAHVAVGVTEAGQAIAVFAADENGNLTGMSSGDEGLGIMLLKWGQRGSEYENVLGIELEAGFYPLISADGESVYYPDGEMQKPSALKNASLVPVFVAEYRSPELVLVQDQLRTNTDGRFEIEDGGSIWDSNAKSLVPGISVDRNGEVFITVDGEEKSMGTTEIKANSDGNLMVGDFVFDGENGWETIKTFQLCKFADFLSCPVSLEDIPAKQNFVHRQVNTEMFNLDNLKYLKMNELGSSEKSFLVPDVSSAPNYEGADSERAPFIKDNDWNGYTMIDGIKYVNVNVPYVVKLPDGTNKIVVLTGLSEMSGGGYDQVAIGYFNDRMNVIPWRVDDESIDLATQFVNPATGRKFTKTEIKGIFAEMKQGDFSRADGLVLFFEIARSQNGWFQ